MPTKDIIVVIGVSLVLWTAPMGFSQTTEAAAAEIQALKLRIAELETQNRAILDALRAIKSKLGLDAEPAAAPSSAITAVSAPNPTDTGSKRVVLWDELNAGG